LAFLLAAGSPGDGHGTSNSRRAPTQAAPSTALSATRAFWFTQRMAHDDADTTRTAEDRGPIFAIVNPASGNGSTARYWPRARATFAEAGLVMEEALTEGPGHATTLALAAGDQGYRIVLCVGGDGTTNEVANGLLQLPTLARPALATLPRGTGGDLAKSLDMAPGAAEAAARLVRGRERAMDVASCTYRGLDGTNTRRFFLNIADVGIGGYVAERVNRSSKAFGGFASFLWATLAVFATMRKPELTLTIDGKERYRGPATSMAVCNGPRFGGGMLMAPGALVDDGVLDVVVIGDITKADLALNLPKLYRGTHLTHPKVETYPGREIVIESGAPAPLEIDGEHPGTTPFHVWVEPTALRMIV